MNVTISINTTINHVVSNTVRSLMPPYTDGHIVIHICLQVWRFSVQHTCFCTYVLAKRTCAHCLIMSVTTHVLYDVNTPVDKLQHHGDPPCVCTFILAWYNYISMSRREQGTCTTAKLQVYPDICFPEQIHVATTYIRIQRVLYLYVHINKGV